MRVPALPLEFSCLGPTLALNGREEPWSFPFPWSPYWQLPQMRRGSADSFFKVLQAFPDSYLNVFPAFTCCPLPKPPAHFVTLLGTKVCYNCLLWLNRLPPNLVAYNSNNHLLSYIVSVGWEFRNRIAGRFWLRGPHEAAVQMLTGVAVIRAFDWGGGISFQAGSLLWLLAGGLSFSSQGIHYRTTRVFLRHDSWLPLEWENQKRMVDASMSSVI